MAYACLDCGWFEPRPKSRVARITPAGKRALRPLLGGDAV